MLAAEAQPRDVMGIRAAAKELGVAASTISRQVAQGKIPNRGAAKQPMVSLAEARRARERNLDPAQQRELPSVAEPKAGFQHHRTEHEAIKAATAKIEYARLLGQVVDRAEAEDLFATLGRAIREALAQRWPLLASELHGLTAAEIAEHGRAADEALLDRIIQDLQQGLARGSGD